MLTTTEPAPNRVDASFRDPSGFVFKRNGKFLRQINSVYREAYDLLMSSGLYDALVAKGQLLSHTELQGAEAASGTSYKIIEPQQLNFISYPYEWSFSQLKDAALLTLEIQRAALDHGMALKDASAYNVQFVNGKPVFIDTLSFDKYTEGEPWVAYRQFCQHFLAPLVLMHYRDIRLGKLLSSFIDGIPLDLASSLLPRKTRFRISVLTHIHLHASTQKKYESETTVKNTRTGKVSRMGMLGILDNLSSLVKSLTWNPGGTEWADYYNNTNYTDSSFAEKKGIIDGFIAKVNPKSVWDLGANTGVFSRIASDKGIDTVAFDIDPSAVEKNYLRVKHEKEERILPLVMDLTNPSPGVGWASAERTAFIERSRTDMVMALALIHHIAISNNVPLSMVASLFSRLGKHAIVEFVPKSDSQVKRLLATREDVFDRYDQKSFEEDFGRYFDVLDAVPVPGSERTLYLFRTK
jgi:hypothetical protein